MFNLKVVYEKYKIAPDKIFNVDETGFTNIRFPQKVLAAKKIRRLDAVTSGKRVNITVVCVLSTSGSYILPLFIYPRQRLPPPEFIYRLFQEVIFCDWLVHFSKHGNAFTHTTLKAYNFCKKNGIIVDVAFYGPLKSAYN